MAVAYVNFRFYKMSENKKMSGLSSRVFAALVYTIIELIVTIISAVAKMGSAGGIFIVWILGVVFAFIFIPAGGSSRGGLKKGHLQCLSSSTWNASPCTPLPPPAANVRNLSNMRKTNVVHRTIQPLVLRLRQEIRLNFSHFLFFIFWN